MGRFRMESIAVNPVRKIVEYDSLSRRVWILGQRCHHGATGSLVTVAAFLALLGDTVPEPSAGARLLLALAAAGSGALLMAHDWKDRSMWFERGRGSQF
jgi:hypothetical protein